MAKKKLLIAAMIVGLFASVLVYLAIRKQGEEVRQLKQNQVEVVKASRNIPSGTPLAQEHITVDKVPKKFLPHNVLLRSDVQVYLGQPLKNDIKEGAMIVTNDFEVEQSAKTLAAKIPMDERAMSMPVDQISGLSGLLNPGDRVDVLGTFPVGNEEQLIPEAGGGASVGYVTMTLLQNVTLLATGDKIAEAGGNRSGGYGTVTVSVTVEEAELLTIAQTRGDLALLLRNPNDVKIDRIKRKTLRGVLENLEVINTKRKKRTKKRRRRIKTKKKEEEPGIEIIRGGQ